MLISKFSDGKSFNPRPPHGGRRHTSHESTWVQTFQSTPSARRATGDHARL